MNTEFDFPIHSPLEQVNYNVPAGFRLFIKRDDLIHPLISGNKWRKLKYSLIDAKAQNKNTIVTFGGAYSNHLLACAAACAKFSFKSIGYVRGEEQKELNPMLFFCRLLGMELRYITREKYHHKNEIFNSDFKENDNAYFIDEGGLSHLGAKGCEEIINELNQTFDHVFLASGTGCTTAGILKSLRYQNSKTRVHSVTVHKNTNEVLTNIQNIIGLNEPLLEIHDTGMFGSYGKDTPELLKFCMDFQQNTGILLDPIYTGKALYKCYDWMFQNKSNDCDVLFIHTGGIMGNLGKQDAFKKVLSH